MANCVPSSVCSEPMLPVPRWNSANAKTNELDGANGTLESTPGVPAGETVTVAREPCIDSKGALTRTQRVGHEIGA